MHVGPHTNSNTAHRGLGPIGNVVIIVIHQKLPYTNRQKANSFKLCLIAAGFFYGPEALNNVLSLLPASVSISHIRTVV